MDGLPDDIICLIFRKTSCLGGIAMCFVCVKISKSIRYESKRCTKSILGGYNNYCIDHNYFELLKWSHHYLKCPITNSNVRIAERTNNQLVKKWLIYNSLAPTISSRCRTAINTTALLLLFVEMFIFSCAIVSLFSISWIVIIPVVYVFRLVT